MKRVLSFLLVSAVAVSALHAQTISGRSNTVKLDFSTLPKSSPPVFTWLSPDHGTTLEVTKAVVKIGIASHPKLRLKSVTLLKNGLQVAVTNSSGSPEAMNFTYFVDKELDLSPGPNEIKMVAENERGELTTESRIIHVNVALEDRAPTYADLGISTVPTYHALIIGVSDYQYNGPGLPSLDKPAKDAEKLYQVLTAKYAFPLQNTTLLKNPTREQMIDAFDALIRRVNEKDNVLIFYAGHGHHEKETGFGYWLPSDAKRDSRSAWIPNSQIKDYIGAMKAKHALLITDACFSGSIFKTRRVDAAALTLKISEIYRDKSRKAMTSGNLSEVPDESYFIRYLLKSLDENEQVFMTSTSLFSRIFDPVTNNTTTSPQYGVIQGAGDEGGDFIFFKKMDK
jgi:hypothetical protein